MTFADTIDTSLLEIGIGLSLLLLESLPPVLLLADLSHRREKKGEEREEFRFSANVNGNVRHGTGWRLDDRAKTFRGFFSSGRIESNAL